MASQLTVDSIVGATTSNTVHVPGHVIQVVSVVSTSLNVTQTGLTIIDTGLAVNITPTSNTSKIYVTSSFNGGTDTNGQAGVFYLYRDSTKLMTQGGDYTGGGGNSFGGHALIMLDSPATTSQITYKIRMNCQTANHVVRFNTDYGTVTGELATITAMEIAQ